MSTNLTVTGRVWVFGDSLNTDAMCPPDAMKLDIAEAAKMVFHEVRPAGPRRLPGATLWWRAALFSQLGVAALVAGEFNSLFFRNAINAGLPAMTVPTATSAFSDGDTGTFDLRTGVLEIHAGGGVLPRLAEQGYLPADLADQLRSPTVAAAGQGSGA